MLGGSGGGGGNGGSGDWGWWWGGGGTFANAKAQLCSLQRSREEGEKKNHISERLERHMAVRPHLLFKSNIPEILAGHSYSLGAWADQKLYQPYSQN